MLGQEEPRRCGRRDALAELVGCASGRDMFIGCCFFLIDRCKSIFTLIGYIY